MNLIIRGRDRFDNLLELFRLKIIIGVDVIIFLKIKSLIVEVKV